MQGTAEFHHEITDARLPQTEPVFHNTTALDTAVDMLDPQPAVMQGLVGHFGVPAAITGFFTVSRVLRQMSQMGVSALRQ